MSQSESLWDVNSRQKTPSCGALRPFSGHFRRTKSRKKPRVEGCSGVRVQFFTGLLCKKMNNAKLGQT
ncbi:hypothetical protein Q6A58_35890, partial [Pseudomonas aeruginosa]|uniref:hypothetical protein n=1 Tax=Pseudomonas aeruginosa TaxID=287 RepID=UPI00271291B0